MQTHTLWSAYRLRQKRRNALLRAYLARRKLSPPARAFTAGPDDIRLFCCLRNEMERLPDFLKHYRRLGVRHFLMVDNGSDDDSAAYLAAQPDVWLWQTRASYRDARFGMDWINGLLLAHGQGAWCLTVDADELLVYPDHDTTPLPALTRQLDAAGQDVMAALMLDLYPEGPLSGALSLDDLTAFDAWGYDWEYQPRYGNISIRGGPRKRCFFRERPDHAPHLHKTPLLRWHWRYAYLSSTHLLLPRRLNRGFDPRHGLMTGALLHSKFLASSMDRAREDQHRKQHFTHVENYTRYYDALTDDPILAGPPTATGPTAAHLEALGLITRGSRGTKSDETTAN
ncbi:glycosyltransferase family 2 protein [Thioclava sp. 'Guangxiensis']|uniref:glycosyltransferase family 2 protein n=1 Tax=Thioclava sp. 'Guangxiensis' TaxID=3149044 RepID=UPI003877A5C6